MPVAANCDHIAVICEISGCCCYNTSRWQQYSFTCSDLCWHIDIRSWWVYL